MVTRSDEPRRGPAARAWRLARASAIRRCRPGPSARVDQLAEHREPRAVRSSSSSSAARFCSAMSRHISGELAAMRVKSRKPPAAKPKSSAASARAAISETSANDKQVRQVAHGREDAVVAGASRWRRAPPAASQQARTRSTASGAVSGDRRRARRARP